MGSMNEARIVALRFGFERVDLYQYTVFLIMIIIF